MPHSVHHIIIITIIIAYNDYYNYAGHDRLHSMLPLELNYRRNLTHGTYTWVLQRLL